MVVSAIASTPHLVYIRTRETYGTRRLQTELADNGIIVGRDRLAGLRKELRLHCKQKRKFRATTNSDHNLPVTPNLMNQNFTPTAPNQVWVADSVVQAFRNQPTEGAGRETAAYAVR
ncbi:IS3 family transposase [Shigella flexneri]|nr:IS3 family transposase [Shigella flexneri]